MGHGLAVRGGEVLVRSRVEFWCRRGGGVLARRQVGEMKALYNCLSI